MEFDLEIEGERKELGSVYIYLKTISLQGWTGKEVFLSAETFFQIFTLFSVPVSLSMFGLLISLLLEATLLIEQFVF